MILSHFINRKNKKPRALVFVDYEHWFYSYRKFYHIKPDFRSWHQELDEYYDVEDITFFGNFSYTMIGKEVEKLKADGNHVVNTFNDEMGVIKDFTDFFMLDAIYKATTKKNIPDVFVIFSGDAHFLIVSNYLCELGKTVIIYGEKNSFSTRLKNVAHDFVEMPREGKELQYFDEMVLESLKQLEQYGQRATYWKTVETISREDRVPGYKIELAIERLRLAHYVDWELIPMEGSFQEVLSLNWEVLLEDKKFEQIY